MTSWADKTPTEIMANLHLALESVFKNDPGLVMQPYWAWELDMDAVSEYFKVKEDQKLVPVAQEIMDKAFSVGRLQV